MDKPLKSSSIDRRTFAKTVTAAGIGMAVGRSTAGAQGRGAAGTRKRYALVGTGGRSGMYRDAILRTYRIPGYGDVLARGILHSEIHPAGILVAETDKLGVLARPRTILIW